MMRSAFIYCSQFYKIYVISFKRGRFFMSVLLKYTSILKKWGDVRDDTKLG